MKNAGWVRDALLGALGAFSMWQLTKLVNSVDSLNEKMATVVTQQNYLNKSASDHEDRIRKLEKK